MRLKYIVIALFILLASKHALASMPIVGYGSSDVVLPAMNQELYYLGFEAGLMRKLGNGRLSDYVVSCQISDGSHLGAVRSARELLERGVKIIAGFPTSHEALLVARLTSSKKILSIFPSAGHAELAQLGDAIYSTGEPMSVTVSTVIEIANSIDGGLGNGLIIYNPRALFSIDQEKELTRQLANGRYDGLKLDKAYLSKDLKLTDNIISSLREGKYEYVIITMYPDESVQIMKQLDENDVEVPIITNSSWSTGDIEFLRRMIAHRRAPIYGYALWLENGYHIRDISKYIVNKYGRKPTTEIIDGYDLGIVVGTLINRINHASGSKDPIDVFNGDLCFDDTSAGKMCFQKGGGHARRNIYKVKISKNGWVPMK